MGDFFSDAYWNFDSKALYLAEKGVKAWNWTTGGRKADLANVTRGVSGGLVTTGFFLAEPIFGLFAVYELIVLPGIFSKNKEIESKEDEFAQEGAKSDPNSPFYKSHRIGSNFDLGLAGLISYDPFDLSGSEFVSLGFIGRSASSYVIRVDNNPPKRKNVLSRAKDKLVEKVKEIRLPSPSPMPAPGMSVFNYSPKLEHYFLRNL